MIIIVWPNGDWCPEDEYAEYSQNKSDDCRSFLVPEAWDEREDEYALVVSNEV